MKKTLSCVLMVMIGALGWSQAIRFEGKVLDSLGRPIVAANIIAFEAMEGAMGAFGISNETGTFRLNLKAEKPYRIKISAIGFETLDFELFAKGDVTKEYTLQTFVETLEEVEVTYEMPVTIKGDTIVYNADSFSTGTERKLGDLLENMPGVEINSDGQIRVEGKDVTKVMVEGKDFFDGDTKLASENIPADAVSKVEVLRNFNEVSQMRKLSNNEDNVAMNIKLKEGKKRFWFGEVGGGGGPEKRYLANPKLFYYSPKTSVNIIGNTNNLGKNPLSFRDYLNFSGGLKNLQGDDGTVIRLSNDSFGFSSFLSEQAAANRNTLGAFNFSYAPTEKLEFSGFAIQTGNRVTLISESQKNYFATGVTEKNTSQTILKDQNQIYKLSSIFQPHDDFQWDHDLFIKKGNISQTGRRFSEALLSENINTLNEEQPLTINQQMNLYYTLDERHVFSGAAVLGYDNQNPFYRLQRDRSPFSALLPLNTDSSSADINQSRNTKTLQWQLKLDYYYILNRKSNLNFTVSHAQNQQDFNSNIFQILDGNQVLNFNDPTLKNDVTFNIKDTYAGFFYRMVSGDFKFDTGFTVHRYTTFDEQLDTREENRFVTVLPKVQMSYNFRSSEQLRFTYRMSNAFSDVNALARGYIFNNYNTFYRGNRNLEVAQYANYNLNYSNFNMFNFTNIMASLQYSKKQNPFKNDVSIQGIDQVATTINSNFPDHNYAFNGYFQKRFSKLKWQIKTNLSFAKLNNIINGAYTQSNSFAQFYQSSLATSFKDLPNIELGYEFTSNRYEQEKRTDTYLTDSPYVRFDTLIGKNMVFVLDYSYNNYRNTVQTINEYHIFEGEISYRKEDGHWEYSIEATNLLNNVAINRDSFNELLSTTSTFTIQPRYFLFSVRYHL